MIEYEIMLVEYTELDNGCPAICICNDFIVPITSKNFAKNFIGAYDRELKHKLDGIGTGLISFKIVEEEQEILELFYRGLSVGFVTMYDMYIVFIKCYNALINME